ncbi:MAG: hypothetical protein AB1540_09580 [Bdellovibrionota bacterium]
MTKITAFLVGSLLFAACFGCSSSVFTGDKSSDYQGTAATAGEINTKCLGLHLSSDTLSVPMVRGLVKCLNSNNSIPAYEGLIQSLDDQELGALIQVLNIEIFSNKQVLKNLDVSFTQMNRAGIADRVFSNVGKLLSREKLITSVIKALKQLSYERSQFDISVLRSVQEYSKDLSAMDYVSRVKRLLELGLETERLDAYSRMTQGLRVSILPDDPDLRALTASALEFVKSKAQDKKGIGKVLVHGVADGSLFYALNHYFTGHPGYTIHDQVFGLERFIQTLTLNNRDDLYKRLIEAYQKFNQPISCLGGTKEVLSPILTLGKQLSEQSPERAPYWVERSFTLKMKTAAGACQYPEGTSKALDTLRLFNRVDRGLVATMAMALNSLAQAEKRGEGAKEDRYHKLLIDLLGDTASVTFYTHLTDLVAELSRSDRDVVGNLLYLVHAALLSSESSPIHQENIQALTKLALIERESLKKESFFLGRPKVRSVYDVITDNLERLELATVYDLVTELRSILDEDQKYLEPILSALHDGLTVNAVHPYLDLGVSLGRNAEGYKDFFTTLFKLSEKSEFSEALSLTASMARDGKLKTLLEGFLAMFRGSTRDLGAPEYLGLNSHTATASYLGTLQNFSTIARAEWVAKPVYWPAREDSVAACRSIDIDLSLDSIDDAGWTDQFLAVGKCSNSENDYKAFENLMACASNPKMLVRESKPLAQFIVDAVVSLIRNSEPATKRVLLDRLGDLLADPRYFEQLRESQHLLKFFFLKKYCTIDSARCSTDLEMSVSETIARLFSQIAGRREKELQATLELLGKLVADASLQDAVKVIDEASKEAKKDEWIENRPHPSLESDFIDIVALKKKIREVESVPESQIDEVAKERIRHYWQQVVSWKPKFAYESSEEFKKALYPLIEQFARPGVFESILEFFFQLDRNPYDADWWQEWHHRLASNVRPVLYYYPGSYPGVDKPKVRLVSQIDMLELVFIEADFTPSDIHPAAIVMGLIDGEGPRESYAMQFLSKLAQSSPRANPQGKDTLDAWVKEMNGRVICSYRELMAQEINDGICKDYVSLSEGISELRVRRHVYGSNKDIARRIFNLYQVYPVISELYKTQQTVQRPGRNHLLPRNDMGLVRDLCFDVLKATDRDDWNKWRKDVNSLGFISELVLFGLMRNVGTEVWYQEDDRVAVPKPLPIRHILRVLAEVAYVKKGDRYEVNPDTIETLDFLLRRDGNPYSKSFNERYRFLGALIDAVFEWTKADTRYRVAGEPDPYRQMDKVKRAGSAMISLLDQAAERSTLRGSNVLEKLPRVLKLLLGTAQGTKLLRENIHSLEPLFVKAKTIHFLDGLNRHAENAPLLDLVTKFIEEAASQNARTGQAAVDLLRFLNQDPRPEYQKRPITQIKHAVNGLLEDPEFKAYRESSLDKTGRDVLDWFTGSEGDQVLVVERLKQFTSTQLSNGNVAALTGYVGRYGSYGSAGDRGPDRCYSNLSDLGSEHYVQGIQGFLDLLRSGIVDKQ